MISENDVKYIASLSRIHLKDEEVKVLQKSLESILHYVEKLKEVDVTNVLPTTHALAMQNVFREDIVKPSLTQKQVLELSIENHKGSFKVPKVIE